MYFPAYGVWFNFRQTPQYTPANGAENDPNAGRILRKSWLFLRKSWLFLAGAGRFSIPVCRPGWGEMRIWDTE